MNTATSKVDISNLRKVFRIFCHASGDLNSPVLHELDWTPAPAQMSITGLEAYVISASTNYNATWKIGSRTKSHWVVFWTPLSDDSKESFHDSRGVGCLRGPLRFSEELCDVLNLNLTSCLHLFPANDAAPGSLVSPHTGLPISTSRSQGRHDAIENLGEALNGTRTSSHVDRVREIRTAATPSSIYSPSLDSKIRDYVRGGSSGISIERKSAENRGLDWRI